MFNATLKWIEHLIYTRMCNCKMTKLIRDVLSVNPFTDRPLSEDTLSLIIDRTDEIEQFERIMKQVASGFKQNLAILGEDGSGKTSLLNYLEAKAALYGEVLVVPQEITTDTTELIFFKGLVWSVIRAVEKKTGLIRSETSLIEKRVRGIITKKEDKVGITAALTVLVHFGTSVESKSSETRSSYRDITEIIPDLETVVNSSLIDAKTIMVILDEAGYAATEKTKSLLQRFRLLFQKTRFMLVVGGNPKTLDDLIGIEPTIGNLFAERMRLRRLTEQEVSKLVASRLNPVRLSGKDIEPFTQDAIHELWVQSSGVPRDCVKICYAAVNLSLCNEEIKSGEIVDASRKILCEKGNDLLARMDNTHKRIASELVNGSNYPAAIAVKFGEPRNTVSIQLENMEKRGYVTSERKGKKVMYRLVRALEAALSKED